MSETGERNQAWLEAEARRLVLKSAVLWLERRFVPSVFAIEGARDHLKLLLDDLAELPRSGDPDEQLQTLRGALLFQSRRCEELRKAARRTQRLPIDALCDCFGLDLFEEQVVLLALAQVVDPRLGWITSALRGHEELTAPTVALALELFTTREEHVEALRAFLPAGALRVGGLLHVGHGPRRERRPFVPYQDRELQLQDWVLAWLLGSTDFLPEHRAVVKLRSADWTVGELVLPRATRNAVDDLLRTRGAGNDDHTIVQMSGPRSSSRKTTAAAIAGRIAVVDARRISSGGQVDAALLRTVSSAARLHDAALYLDHAEQVWAELPEPEEVVRHLADLLAELPGRIYLGVDRPAPIGALDVGCPVAVLPFARPTVDERAQLWRALLPDDLRPDDTAVAQLSQRHAFTAAELHKVVDSLLNDGSKLGLMRRITLEAADLACERQLALTLRPLGSVVSTGMVWSDLVLDDELRRRFDEILLYATWRETLFDQWGFGRRYSRGRGLSILLSGPPGTGKTQSAELLAQDLRMRLFKVDVASIVDKYVGETEKRLAELFERAHASGSILLFDEADSLFVKRVEVRSATDRYANQSVNFLLQKIEEHPGIVILTTNLSDELDPAIKRRLNFVITFTEPDREQRALIWRQCIPAEAPVDADVDWKYLGHRYELNGGHIKNVVLRAALKAASGEARISMHLLEDEARRELQSLGRLVQG